MHMADPIMSDGRSLAQTLHFWLRIQGQNWEDGFPPSEPETRWIRLALQAARQGNLGRAQECILHAILKDRSPPEDGAGYDLNRFRNDLAAFQSRYLDDH
jgi:hypothetical protein